MNSLTLIILIAVLSPIGVMAETPVPAPAKLAPPLFYGYQKDISIADAIAEFSRRQKADDIGKTQPMLTENEVLGAVILAMDETSILTGSVAPSIAERRHVLGKIAQTRNLPRGSKLELMSSRDFTKPDSDVEIEFWKVKLLLGFTIPNDSSLMLREVEGAKPIWEVPIRLNILAIKGSHLGEGAVIRGKKE